MSTVPKIFQEDVRKRDNKARTFAPLDNTDEAKIQRSNIIGKDLSTVPEIFQEDVRKRDDKVRTFAPLDNTDKDKRVLKELTRLKYTDDSIKFTKFSFDKTKRSKDLERTKFSKNINKYESIDLNGVNDLIDVINSEIIERDNIVDLGNNKEIYFRDLTNFLYDIKDGKISDFNKEREYQKRLKNTENKLANRTNFNKYTRLYEQYINILKRILFSDKKSSGRGLTISSLPILLSKIYTNNSSKELINNIEQLIKNLYDNKQITKQVYNILNKALMSTRFIKNDS